jgi:hypothetical protein
MFLIVNIVFVWFISSQGLDTMEKILAHRRSKSQPDGIKDTQVHEFIVSSKPLFRSLIKHGVVNLGNVTQQDAQAPAAKTAKTAKTVKTAKTAKTAKTVKATKTSTTEATNAVSLGISQEVTEAATALIKGKRVYFTGFRDGALRYARWIISLSFGSHGTPQ